jgi:hypothetical protein
MKPGKHLTPTPELDLEKLWRALKEEPPGNIRTLNRTEKDANAASSNSSRR